MDKRTLTVTIKRPERSEFLGKASALTSINMRGQFDILPYHSNFITLIKDKVTVHLENKQPITYSLQSGIIKVSGDKVTVLIGIETHI